MGYKESANIDNDPEVEIIMTSSPFEINLFNVLTDGVCILLSGIKLLYGIRYLLNVTIPKKITYEYLDDGLGKF